ncbi:hypothetical protein [Ileibacterium valens]|uniref:hypothetical protein n=1 Tax=Ileibacterium valens TaxID=1862668 RepID=UPI002356E2D2|nr:hypothetical protein [Ileibacterium valens]
MNKNMQNLSAGLLAAALSFTCMPASVFAEEKENSKTNPENGTEKTETVYTFINEDGDIKKTLVSSWIHNENGIKNIKENLDLKEVENVKTEEEPVVKGDEYTWSVEGKDVYYQGVTDKELPVTVDITYELDGKKISAKDLAGKSGHLKTIVSFKNNESKNVNVQGKNVTIHPAFLAGGLMNFDNEVFSDVKCSQGNLINDGNKEMMMFTAVPGLEDTLKTAGLQSIIDKISLADDVIIEADVKNYSAPDIYVALTDDFEVDDIEEISQISELTNGVSELSDAADQLENGAGQLADGTSQLKTGIEPLTSSTDQIELLKQALKQLDDGSGKLRDGITQYTDGVAQLDEGMQSLDQVSNGISQLHEAFTADSELKQGTSSLAAGLSQIEEKLNSMDPSAIEGLDKQLAGYKTQLDSLDQMVASDMQTVDTLGGSLSQMSTLLDQSSKQFSEQLGNIVTSLNQTIAENNAVTEQNNQIAAGLKEQAATANASLDSSRAAINNAIASIDTAIAAGKDTDGSLAASKAQLQNALASMPSVSITSEFASYSMLNPGDLNAAAEALQNNLAQMQQGIDQAKAAMASLQNDLDTAKGALTQFSEQINALKNSEIFQGLMPQVSALKEGISKAAAGAKALDASVSEKLEPASKQLLEQSDAGIKQLQEGSATLNAKSEDLKNGAAQLKSGTAQLNDTSVSLSAMQVGLSELSSAVSQLDDGAKTLHEGTEKFKSEGIVPLKDAVDVASADLESFEKVAKEIKTYTESFESFAGAPKGASTSVRYIYKVESEEQDS